MERTTRRHAIDPLSYVEHVLYEIFLICNISTPGSFSAYDVTIESDNYTPRHARIDSTFFEDAEYLAAENGWPAITSHPVDSVARWFYGLDVGTQQIAESRIAKALFSVLHLCQLDGTEPTVVIWLAQCLESLFAVPTSLAFNFLVSRSEALLGKAPKPKWFRSEWRRFFDARNAFAHGGSEVLHPMTDESIDPRVKDFFWKWVEPADFAASVVVAALQCYAVNQWRDLAWGETIEPLSVGS